MVELIGRYAATSVLPYELLTNGLPFAQYKPVVVISPYAVKLPLSGLYVRAVLIFCSTFPVVADTKVTYAVPPLTLEVTCVLVALVAATTVALVVVK